MRMCSMNFVGGLWMICSCANYWVGMLFYLEIQAILGDLLSAVVIYPGRLLESYERIFRLDLCYLMSDCVVKYKCARKPKYYWSVV